MLGRHVQLHVVLAYSVESEAVQQQVYRASVQISKYNHVIHRFLVQSMVFGVVGVIILIVQLHVVRVHKLAHESVWVN